MLDIILIGLLIIGFFVGLKRGFITQVVHLAGYIIAYIAAYIYYDELAPKLAQWIPYPNFGDNATLKFLTNSSNMEAAFYRTIAFILIFIAVRIALGMIRRMLNIIAHLPILRQANILAGGLLGFIEVYLILFILLYIGALVPIESIQNAMDQSIVAKAIVNHTPILSGQLKQVWMYRGG